jgi:hypothetical protein
MSIDRLMIPGPALDRLVAEKVLDGEIKPYSTDPDYAREVLDAIADHGYEADFIETAVVTCELWKDAKIWYTAWGRTQEEAIARAALKIYGSNPA